MLTLINNTIMKYLISIIALFVALQLISQNTVLQFREYLEW